MDSGSYGEPLYQVEYSDQLLIRLWEANDPERFRRHHQHEHIAKLFETDPRNMTGAQLEVIAQYMLKRVHNGDEAAAAETRRQIEAGTFVIDAKSTAVEST